LETAARCLDEEDRDRLCVLETAARCLDEEDRDRLCVLETAARRLDDEDRLAFADGSCFEGEERGIVATLRRFKGGDFWID